MSDFAYLVYDIQVYHTFRKKPIFLEKQEETHLPPISGEFSGREFAPLDGRALFCMRFALTIRWL